MRKIYLLLIPFVALAIFARNIPFFSFDLTITQYVQNFHTSVFDLLMKAVSSVGYGRIMPFALVSLVTIISFLNLKIEALYLLVSSVTSFMAGSLTKLLVDRPRPGSDIVAIYKEFADNSFPSSHTLTYTVIFGFLIYVAATKLKPSWQKYTILGISSFLVATIGLSRIYLGAHWASDVLGGYLLGGFWLLLTVNIYQAHVQR